MSVPPKGDARRERVGLLLCCVRGRPRLGQTAAKEWEVHCKECGLTSAPHADRAVARQRWNALVRTRKK